MNVEDIKDHIITLQGEVMGIHGKLSNLEKGIKALILVNRDEISNLNEAVSDLAQVLEDDIPESSYAYKRYVEDDDDDEDDDEEDE